MSDSDDSEIRGDLPREVKLEDTVLEIFPGEIIDEQLNMDPVDPPTAAAATPATANLVRLPMMYSLGMIAATLDNFTGKEVARYLEKLEQRSKLDGWSEEETLRLLKFKCVGEAYNYLRSEPELDNLSYADLKRKLLAKFAPIKLPGESQLALSRCYQRHDENISAFCTRLKSIGARVLQEDLQDASPDEEAGLRKKTQALILNQFKVGLRKELWKEMGVTILKEDNLTLDRAEELIKLQETTLQMVQSKGGGARIGNVVRNETCYKCNKKGHLARDCWSANGARKNNPLTECYICHEYGHWARDCPKKRQGNRPDFRDKRYEARQPHPTGFPRSSGAQEARVDMRRNRDSSDRYRDASDRYRDSSDRYRDSSDRYSNHRECRQEQRTRDASSNSNFQNKKQVKFEDSGRRFPASQPSKARHLN